MYSDISVYCLCNNSLNMCVHWYITSILLRHYFEFMLFLDFVKILVWTYSTIHLISNLKKNLKKIKIKSPELYSV